MADANRDSATTGEPTSPYLPTFDTGGFSHPDPLTPLAAKPEPTLTLDREPEPLAYQAFSLDDLERVTVAPPPPPVVVPGAYQFVKRWVFALIVAAVWVIAAPAGAGFYYWWVGDTDVDKTWPVYGVLVYLIVATVAGLVVATAAKRPLISALAIALMSAPVASTAGAAALYGAYVFGWLTL
ncbi:hypothetical protein E4P42_24955 [Mycobacterium sp. PS03-16]|uniref:hypothetical protein n=1 Tax=Mycobacterium sp. PS03-16 TaxID=2559611 RepID=UPI00107465C4|nr:hypothetical protein [Mycobacterium sp. PS03-16]TFV54810.1 hypothetical protein E4P42_24955 [Mycobacterium sp. PS03-16]